MVGLIRAIFGRRLEKKKESQNIDDNLLSHCSKQRQACPFYGFQYSPQFLFFMDTGGNQCGIEHSSFSPCYMEFQGQTPDWQTCNLNSHPFNERETELAKRVRVFPDELIPPNTEKWAGIVLEDWLKYYLGCVSGEEERGR